MEGDCFYIDNKGYFNPKMFKNFLELNYELINTQYKPAAAMRLKSFLMMDTIYCIDKLDATTKREYDRILNEAFRAHGNIDDHIRDCIGKEVHYTLLGGETGAGIIKEFLDHSDKLTEKEKELSLVNIGYKISSKTGDRNMRSEILVIITLVNHQ